MFDYQWDPFKYSRKGTRMWNIFQEHVHVLIHPEQKHDHTDLPCAGNEKTQCTVQSSRISICFSLESEWLH